MRPSVISWAMPRPATIRIRVATIGWMPSTATRKPFHSPQTRPAPSAAASTTGTRMAVGDRLAATAPQIAMTAPTDRSMPRGGDHQHHAERQQRHRRAAIEHVDQAAEQPAVLQAQVEELRRDQAVDQRGSTSKREDLRRGRGAAGRRCHARGLSRRRGIGGDRREDVRRRRWRSPASSATWARSRSTTTRSE